MEIGKHEVHVRWSCQSASAASVADGCREDRILSSVVGGNGRDRKNEEDEEEESGSWATW